MRFYENEFPHEGELVMVQIIALRDNQKNLKKMDVMYHWSNIMEKVE